MTSVHEDQSGRTAVPHSPPGEKPRGTFTAMDMRTNEIAWQKKWDDSCYSGSVTTAGGLVFTGHNDGNLLAYDARNGRRLWKFQTGAGANATPTIFERNGRQKVVFYAAGNTLAGTAHGDNLWMFDLDGDLGPAAAEEDEDEATQQGGTPAELFSTNCSACHGPEGEGGHNGPSLQRARLTRNLDAVVEQIRNGSGPMPPFSDKLTDDQIRALARYVVEEVAPRGGGAPGNEQSGQGK